MFATNEAIAEHVNALFKVCSGRERGQILTHEEIATALGTGPYTGCWKQVVEKLKRRVQKELGIALFSERNVGYRLVLVSEQLTMVPEHHTAKSLRSATRSQRALKELPDRSLRPHQQAVKARKLEGASHLRGQIMMHRRVQEALSKPLQTRPRPLRPQARKDSPLKPIDTNTELLLGTREAEAERRVAAQLAGDVQAGRYDHARCPMCGVPWEEHASACPRHQFRYLYECRGHGRAGIYRCCEHPGVPAAVLLDPCPAGCACHEKGGGV